MTAPGFGVYIHWPFCLSKCPYCDFNSHAAATIDQDRWRAALLRELDHYAAWKPGETVTSIFFGGGTPSLMDPTTVQALIERVARHWAVDPMIEITLEANPSTVEAQSFRDFCSAGVNRLSLGVQALNQRDLSFLGRRHDVAEALAALQLAAKTFPRFTFDLIYARPGQSLEAWQAELKQALSLAGDHLSAYQLTIEEGTAFYPIHERGEFQLPDEDLAAEMFAVTRALCAQAGMPAYEVSNHARPGQESRHNLTYWRGGDYVGVGPGAHGRLNNHATRQHRAPDIWLRRVEEHGHATQVADLLDARTRAEELLMMGLRLTGGIDAGHFQEQCGLDLWQVVDKNAFALLEGEGLIRRTEHGLAASEAGQLLLNSLTAALLG
ncbi:radical SAM family heme chaperone HemW [Magnetospirillum sp. 64-120]|uniref:radical SAM family heme chaperone HemW n=1 Tax=Magnetospirillum sp. 64-120 TaxID=1895778 RepID=UPI00092B7448|nr:radical SAM family heme chaperone HemW [Magnetospirillum sp. 64-120]OJX81768.1 MAG: coproporphyrinogen III oxidase [Magnetospirillum sp. 64-120]